MAELQTPIDTLRQRLNGLLADWGAEFSLVLRELEEKRARLEELDAGGSSRERELEALKKRVEGQEALIETLRSDAEDASRLRREVHMRDAEIERLTAELDSKRELITAIRRDAEEVERLRKSLTLKDRQVGQHEEARREAEHRAEQAGRELEALREKASAQASAQSSELEGLRAELEAQGAELEAQRKLVTSLRADAERARMLESRLEERHEIIEKLEASINRHAGTIVELKGHAERWKQRYRDLRDDSSVHEATTVAVDTEADLTRTDEDAGGAPPQPAPEQPSAEFDEFEHTIAIDMRQPLTEARRAAAAAVSAAPSGRHADDD